MGIAAVVLNFNDAPASLEAAFRFSDMEKVAGVVIVDNASTDESAAYLEKALEGSGKEKIVLHRSDVNLGYGDGNNQGVRKAHELWGAKFVLISNPDSYPDEALVTSLEETLLRHEGAAAAGAVCRIRGASRYEEYLRSGWKYRSFAGELIHSGPIMKRLFRSFINYPESFYEAAHEVPVYAVHGSLLMVDTERFLAVSGFDENCFLYQEEYILGYRLREAGYGTYLVREYYDHLGSHSMIRAGLGSLARQKLRAKAELYYYRKYLGAGAFRIAVARLVQHIVMAETKCLSVFTGR